MSDRLASETWTSEPSVAGGVSSARDAGSGSGRVMLGRRRYVRRWPSVSLPERVSAGARVCGGGRTEADDAVPPGDAVDDVALERAVGGWFDRPDESTGFATDLADVVSAADGVAGEAEGAPGLVWVQVGPAFEPC